MINDIVFELIYEDKSGQIFVLGESGEWEPNEGQNAQLINLYDIVFLEKIATPNGEKVYALPYGMMELKELKELFRIKGKFFC